MIEKESKDTNEVIPTKLDTMVKMIKESITKGLLNDLLEDVINENKIDILQIDDNIKYQITSLYNQKNKNYENISVINLEKCEALLKNKNGINENETLIIFKYDYNIENILIPIVGYDVFHPTTKKVLDLSICEDVKLNISSPVNTNINEENLYKHNPNDNYYKDKCQSASNEKGVDLTIYDRQYEYNFNNFALCGKDCEFISYNNKTKQALCQCEPQFNSSLITWDKIIKKEKLIHSFTDLKKTSNIDVVICYNEFLSLKGIKTNIGSYILLSIVLIYIISLIFFIARGNRTLNNKIEKIIKDFEDSKNNNKTNFNLITINLIQNNLNNLESTKIKRKKKKKKINTNPDSSEIKLRKNKKIKNLKLSNQKENNNKTGIINKMNFIESELNVIEYQIAEKNDNRGYLEFYASLLKTRHILLSIFFPKNDYNSTEIKICLFFFIFALEFVLNSLFFNDGTMHKIYEDEGVFNFVYNLPKILYSMIISTIISFAIKKLGLSENYILVIKKEKDILDVKKKAEKVKKKLSINFVLFFIISFILLIYFWFYIGCFCSVYKNTQIYLLKDTILSFVFSLVIPFIKNLIPCILRIKLLKEPGCIYNFSTILQ